MGDIYFKALFDSVGGYEKGALIMFFFFQFSRLPGWMRPYIPKIFYVEEKAWNYYPYTITGQCSCSTGTVSKNSNHGQLGI